MAKGRRCSQCSNFMSAVKEDYQPKGTYVTYRCLNCKMEEKHFEKNK